MIVAKKLDQRERDRNRKSYRLSFPADLDGERVEAWLRTLSGTLVSSTHRFGGVPTMAFEVWADQTGIQHRLKVPWTHADYVVGQLRSLVPGIRVEPEDVWPERKSWTRAIEVGMTNSSRQLRIYNSGDMAASILASLQSLSDGERLMMQWVVSPTTPQHLPQHQSAKTNELSTHVLLTGGAAGRDEVNDRREKLAEPNLLTVLRIGAVAPTQQRADHLVFRVKAALAAARSPHVKWYKRLLTGEQVAKRIAFASAPLSFPGQLSVPELAALVAWPLGNPFVSGLPTPLSRQLPVPEIVPPAGRVLGRSNMYGQERLVAMSYPEAVMHVHVVGPPGVGKTALLANMIKQDMEKGYGTILIESKGDLFRQALDYVPKERLADVVVLDVNDTRYPVGFNILRQGDPAVVVDELNMLFDQLYKDSPSLWMQEVMYHGLHTLAADPDATFTDLAALVSPNDDEREWRNQLIRQVRDPQIRQFWKRFDGQPPARQDQVAQPVLSRVWPMSRSKLANIIGQSSSSFFMDDVIRQRKILLVNLSGIEQGAANIMGTLLMNAIWQATKRQRDAEKATFLYLDEAHHYMNIPVDMKLMLVEARAMNLGLIFAHQDLSQLPSGMREAIMHNARSRVVFQTSDRDARELAASLGGHLQADDLARLGRYEAVARLMTPAGVSAPFTMSTLAPERGNGGASLVVETSRAVFGRDVLAVQDERLRRRTSVNPKADTPKRPPISEL